jgi:hypothetical protein
LSPNRAPSPGASLLVALAVFGLAAAASAAEYSVRPELSVEQNYDDNPLTVDSSRGIDPDDFSSWTTRMAPAVTLNRRSDTSEASFLLGLARRKTWSVSELDGTDKRLGASLRRSLSSRLSLGARASYDELEAQDPVEDAIGEDIRLLFAERPDTVYRTLSGDAKYMLDDRTELATELSWDSREYDNSTRNDLFDTESRSVSLTLTRNLTPLDRAGVVAGFSRSEENNIDDRFRVTAIDIFGVARIDAIETTTRDDLGTFLTFWERTWSPRWSTVLQAGVRALDTESDTVQKIVLRTDQVPGGCPGGTIACGFSATDSNDDSGTGFLGGLSVTHTYSDNGSVSASYSRDTRTGTTSSTGSSAIDVDAFSASLVHQIAKRVRLTLRGSHTLYETTSDFLVLFSGSSEPERVDGGNDYRLRSAEVRLDWQLRKNLTAYASFRYNDLDQDQVFERTAGDRTERQRDYDRRVFGVGFRYSFDLLGREL